MYLSRHFLIFTLIHQHYLFHIYSHNNCVLFQAKALGRVLFDQVCKQLHLLEADYFGLEHQEASGTKVSIIFNRQCI